MMVLAFVWPHVRHSRCPLTLAEEMGLREGSVFDWKEVRVSLCVEDEVNICDFSVVVLINRACFGDKRLKAEKDRGGVFTVTYCRLLPRRKISSSRDAFIQRNPPLPSTTTPSLSRSSQVWQDHLCHSLTPPKAGHPCCP